MKVRSSILVVGLVLVVVCLVGCKKKTEPAKAESKSPKPSIVQPMQVESNAIGPNTAAKVESRQIVATVNGVNIYMDDFDKRIEQQISPVQKQMPVINSCV